MSEYFIDRLKSGEFKNIIIFSGAGISTNSGIPDYRSSKGIFSKISKDFNCFKPTDCKAVSRLLCRPEDIFSRHFITIHPEIYEHPAYIEFKRQIIEALPSPSHQLAFYLHQKGWLKRVYTQNIDGLYQKSGLPDDMVVEFHGSMSKGNIVLYGDNISQYCYDMVEKDLINDVSRVDLVIVMGTSLQVAPFCGLPNMVRKNCCRVLVDIKPENTFDNNFTPSRGNNRYEYDESKQNLQKSFKFRGQQISLQSWWEPLNKELKLYRGKWKDQYIFKRDCDSWSEDIMTN